MVWFAHSSLYLFLLTPFSDLLPFLWCAVIFEAVGLPADDVDIAFDVAKRGDERVQAWSVVASFTLAFGVLIKRNPQNRANVGYAHFIELNRI